MVTGTTATAMGSTEPGTSGRSADTPPAASSMKRRRQLSVADAGAAGTQSAAPGKGEKRRRAIGHASGTRCVRAGSGDILATPMYDSTGLLESGKGESLRQRLALDGYLLLRGLLPPALVAQAREFTLRALAAERPEAFAPGTDPALGRAAPGAQAVGLLSRQHIARAPPVQAMLESPALFGLAETLLGAGAAQVVTTGFKWLRAVAPGEFTGVHADLVYVGGGTQNIITVWLPVGDVSVEQGGLLVCRGSHRLRSFAALREGYFAETKLKGDGTHSGWISDDGSKLAALLPPGAKPDWRAADVKAGDAVVLRLDVIHMTANNVSGDLRLSCDTRWQPADERRDERIAQWRGPDGQPA